MTAKIEVTDGKSQGAELPLQGKSIFEVGTGKTADLSLVDDGVAGTHLKVYVAARPGQSGPGAEEDFSIFDVSGQGFLHNGKRTLKASVVHGDEIQVGSTRLRLVQEGAAPAAAPAPAPVTTTTNTGAPTLQAVKGNDAGRTYDLRTKEMFIIGRGVATDITVWDIRVSRVHCRIDRDENGYLITDLNASNGTYVNGQKIETHRLKPGDEIKVGSTVLQYQQ